MEEIEISNDIQKLAEKEKPKKSEKKKSGEFGNSDDVEAFCSKKYALSELRAYVNKLGLSEDVFKGVKYKKFLI